jgi:hypothetical protein
MHDRLSCFTLAARTGQRMGKRGGTVGFEFNGSGVKPGEVTIAGME